MLDLLDAGSWNPAFVNNNGGTFESAAAVLGAAVPEPATLGLMSLGLAGMMLRRRRLQPATAPA